MLLVSLLGVAAARPTAAQTPDITTGDFRRPSLSGEVRSADGQSPKTVVVRLETRQGVKVNQAWTASSGRFEFYGVPLGQYYLVVQADGFKPIREAVDLSFGGVMGLILYLVPEEKDPVLAEGDSVNVRELKLPKKALKEYEKGVELLHEGKAAESVAYFQKAIAEYPAFDHAYIQLCLAYIRQRSAADAQRTLEEAILANPKNWRALNLLGRMSRRQKQYERAVELLARSLAVREDSWLAHVEMGEALAGLNRMEEAHVHVARAHVLRPEEPSIHQLYYNVLIKRNQYDAALKELDEFIRLFPEHSLTPRAKQQREALLQAVITKREPGSK
jgi:TolA-binding protein